MRHTLTVDLTDQQESGWAHYFALVNAERAARIPPDPPFATLDDFMVNGPVNPAVLGDDYYTQAVERKKADTKRHLDGLAEKELATPGTLDRIAQAEGIDVSVKADAGLLTEAGGK